jgi:predicted PurR-regulated permease PerM
MLGHFMRAQVALSALAMVVITIGLVVLKVPYSYALGPIAGVLEFIPVIGPIIGGAIVLIVAFAAGSKHMILVLLFLLVWRGVQDYVTSPRIMGGKLELHPLAVLFGVLAGGEVGGVIGVFLSVPVLAAIKIIWRTYNACRIPDNIEVPDPNSPTLVAMP